MRVLLFLAALLLPIPAFALDESIIRYCFTMPNPQSCLEGQLRGERLADDAIARAHTSEALILQQRMIDAQLEQARIQANGMALFGAGNALINGMNQGFQNMQLPYNQPPGRR